MDVAVGVDTEAIARFRTLDPVRDRRFFARTYTTSELTYCFAQSDPAPHLAARWCAKEAVVKALAGLGIAGVAYCEIAVTRGADGVPSVRVRGLARPVRLRVSVSHSAEHAIAFVIAYANPSGGTTDAHRTPRELHRAADC